MPYRDARCVYVARNLSEAETMVSFLASHDIEAKTIDSNTANWIDGLVALAGASSRGIEVWVDESRHAEVAKLLSENAALFAERASEGKNRGPIDVVCEKCGKKTTFPGELYGTIQECRKCGAYLDLGPQEDWAAEAESAEPVDVVDETEDDDAPQTEVK